LHVFFENYWLWGTRQNEESVDGYLLPATIGTSGLIGFVVKPDNEAIFFFKNRNRL